MEVYIMIISVVVLIGAVATVLYESKSGLTVDQKQSRNRKIRAEYGKKY